MSEERPTDLLSALPRTRPHRRSDKRGARPEGRKADAEAAKGAATAKPKAASKAGAAKPKPGPQPRSGARKTARRSSETRMRQPAQPRGIPSARRAPKRKPAPATGTELVGTAVQAVGELAEIGLALGTRALRNALGRLPRP